MVYMSFAVFLIIENVRRCDISVLSLTPFGAQYIRQTRLLPAMS